MVAAQSTAGLPAAEASNKPQEFDLDDDLLLQNIHFTESKENNVLDPLDQAILLAFWYLFLFFFFLLPFLFQC